MPTAFDAPLPGKVRKHKQARQLLLLLLTMILGPTVLAANSPAGKPADIVITIAALAPYSENADGTAGFMNEWLGAIFAELGKVARVDQLPAARGLELANNGIVDGTNRIGGLASNYKNLIEVPTPLFQTHCILAASFEVESWDQLAGKRIGYINGWKIAEQHIPKSAIATPLTRFSQMKTLMGENRLDGMVFEEWQARLLLNDVNVSFSDLADMVMKLYVHKKHSALVPALDAAIIKLKQDGTYDRIFQQHLAPLEDAR